MNNQGGIKKIYITEYAIIACLLILKVWCGFFNQFLLFAIGGLASTAIDILLCAYLVLNANRKKNENRINTKTNNFLGSWIGFAILYSLIFSIGGELLVQYSFLGIFDMAKQIYDMAFGVIYLVPLILIVKNLTERERNFVSNFVIILFFAVALANLIATICNPELVKNEAYNEESSLFTLGYSGAYSLALITPFLFYKLKESKNKILFWGIILCNLISIFYGGYFIAILATLIALLMYNILGAKNKNVAIFFALIVVIGMVIIITSGIMENIMWYLSEQIPIEVISGRCRDIAKYLSGDTVVDTGDTTYRIFIYKDTFENFLKHPILGNYIFNNFDCQWDHATILDLLSVGGLVLTVPFFIFIAVGYRFACMFIPNKKARRTLLAAVIAYLFIAFVNSAMSYKLLGILFVIAPIVMGDKGEDENTDITPL